MPRFVAFAERSWSYLLLLLCSTRCVEALVSAAGFGQAVPVSFQALARGRNPLYSGVLALHQLNFHGSHVCS